MNQKKYDDFADICHGQSGLFGTDQAGLDAGLKQHDGCTATVAPDGLALEFRCNGCGRPRKLTLDFAELVAISHGLNPQAAFRGQAAQLCSDPTAWVWSQKEKSWALRMKCNHCTFHYPVRMGPDEPAKFLKSAYRQSFINPQAAKGVQQHCQRIVQAARGGSARHPQRRR